MLNTRHIALISALILLSGCTGMLMSTQQPDWVEAKSSRYPMEKYLLGRGQAKRQSVAQDRARADLAKVFEVKIAEQSEDIIRHTRKQEGETEIEQLESYISRNVSSQTEQVIAGIQIAEIWKNQKTGDFHALAVLNRMKSINSLEEDIDRLDDLTGKNVREARLTTDLLSRISFASKALEAQAEREAYQRHLKVVDYTGKGLPSPFTLATLYTDHNALLKQLRIQPVVSADPLGNLEDILKGAISNAGFSHESKNKPTFGLNTRLTLNPIKDKEGWHWLRGTLEIELQALASKQVRGSKRWNIKVSAQDPATAKQRAADKIDQILKQELRQTVIGFAAAK